MVSADLRLRFALLSALLFAAGCASSTEDPEAARTVRFAVIAAPRVGAPAPNKGPGVGADDEDPLSSEDLLLEAVTELSTDPAIDFTLVPGPLVAKDDEESREGLVGAVGSLAGRVYPALAKDEPGAEALLEALGKALKGHEGEAGVWGKRVGRLRPIALPPSGETPEDPKKKKKEQDAEGGEAERKTLLVAVRGRGVPAGTFPLEVAVGEAVKLEQAGGRVVLTLPPLHRPPHVYAIVKVEDGNLSVTLASAEPGRKDLPKPPAPVRLWPSVAVPEDGDPQ